MATWHRLLVAGLCALLPSLVRAAQEPEGAAAEACRAGADEQACAAKAADDDMVALQLKAQRAQNLSAGPHWFQEGCKTDLGFCSHTLCSLRNGPNTCVKCAKTHMKVCRCDPGFCLDGWGKCVSEATKIFAKVKATKTVEDLNKLLSPNGKVTTALCSSGGGNRALSYSLGVFRGLTNIGAMKKMDMLSTVSGSSWLSAPYMFANRTDEQLLGKATTPSALTLAFLAGNQSEIGACATTELNSKLIEALLAKTPLHTIWTKATSETYLAPFGLNNLGSYMAKSGADVERIKKLNPALADATFYTMNPNRPPAYVINAMLVAPKGYENMANESVSLQISPDYTGTPFYPDNSTIDYLPKMATPYRKDISMTVGGGFVETFAFNGGEPYAHDDQDGMDDKPVALPAPKVPMSLGDAQAASSWYYGLRMAGTMLASLDPSVNYWPITSEQFPDANRSTPYWLSDGGSIDISGVLTALQRKAEKVVWVVASGDFLNRTFDWDGWCDAGKMRSGRVAADFMANGTGLDVQVSDKYGFGHEYTTDTEWLLHNQVFGHERLVETACLIWEKVSAGKPAVFEQAFDVMENAWWGIPGGWKTKMVIIYLENVTDFNDALPKETQAEIAKGEEGAFTGWPLFGTMNQNPPEISGYTMSQVNILAALGEYVVKASEKLIMDFLA